MLHGQDETILPSLAQGGARGGIGGTTNYNGRELTGIIEAWNNGDIETAREKQNFSQAVINVICHFRGNIVGGKRIMKLLGFDLGPNRVPFRNMTDEEEAQMKKELEEIGFLERANKFLTFFARRTNYKEMNVKEYIQSWADSYKKDLTENIMPFWMEHGWDRENGGVYTCVNRDGSLMDTTKSVWFQGRFAFICAYAYNNIE